MKSIRYALIATIVCGLVFSALTSSFVFAGGMICDGGNINYLGTTPLEMCNGVLIDPTIKTLTGYIGNYTNNPIGMHGTLYKLTLNSNSDILNVGLFASPVGFYGTKMTYVSFTGDLLSSQKYLSPAGSYGTKYAIRLSSDINLLDLSKFISTVGYYGTRYNLTLDPKLNLLDLQRYTSVVGFYGTKYSLALDPNLNLLEYNKFTSTLGDCGNQYTLILDSAYDLLDETYFTSPIGYYNDALNQGQISMYCDTTDTTTGRLCISPTTREEHYLNSQKNQEISANLVSAQDEADPVSLTTGEFTYDTNVMHMPGKGMSFDFGISYKNQYQYSGPLGNNFDFTYNRSITIDPSTGNAVYANGQLSKISFIKNPDNTFVYQKSLNATLSKTWLGDYIIAFDSGNKEYFSSIGKLTKIKDRIGNNITFEYGDDEKLHAIYDTLGRKITLYYNDDKISQLIDFNGRQVFFNYYTDSDIDGEAGDLKNIVLSFDFTLSRDKTISFTYARNESVDSKLSHNIARITDAKGQTYVENTYDTYDRVTSQKYGDGDVHYAYTVLQNSAINGVSSTMTPFLQTRVRNRNGILTDYIYNNQFNTLSRRVHNQTGNTYTVFNFEYDSNGNLIKEITPKGGGKIYTYDDRGNVIETREKTDIKLANSDADLVMNFVYDSTFHKIIEQTKPDGSRVHFTLDGNGNTTEISTTGVVLDGSSSGATSDIVIKNEYNSNGLITRTTDAEGNITDFVYDKGLLVKSIKYAKDRGGVLGLFADTSRDIIDTYQYDDYGNIVSKKDAEGNTTTLTYNEFNNLTQSISPLGITKKYLYDANNNVTSSKTVIASDSGPTSTATFNSLDYPTEEAYPIDGSSTTKVTKKYDNNENVTEMEAENGTKQVFEYDEFDRVVNKGVWAKDTSGNYQRTALVTTVYDKNGNITQTKDLKNFITTFEYDGFDQLIKSTDGLGNVTVFVRDKLGRETETRTYNTSGILVSKINTVYNTLDSVIKKSSALVDSTGNITETQENTFAYNKNGKLIRAIDARGGISELTYDEFSRAVATTDALGSMTKSFYDKRGLLTKKEFWNKGSNGILALKTTDLAEYDAEGRIIKQTNTDGKSKIFEYNMLGQITKSTDENGNATDYTYNYAGKKLTETSYRAGTPVTLQYAYDVYGNNISLTDEKRQVTHYEYDTQSRLTKQKYPDGSVVSYEYNLLGDLVKKTDSNGNVISNTYDIANRLTERNITLGAGVKGVTQETYVYDSLGRLISANDSENKALSFQYDSLGRLLSETRAGATVSYHYDALGNITDMTYPSGRIIHRDIDVLGRVSSITTNSATIANYVHDGLLLSNVNLSNGVSEKYSYDSLLRLKDLSVTKQDYTSLFSRSLSYDNVGNILSDGQNNYSYDTLYSLTHAHYGETGENENFGYDAAGNREDATGKQGNLSYASNNLNQYTTITPSTGTGKTLVYDNNGNIKDDGIYTFVYDYHNRIVEVSKKEGVIFIPIIPPTNNSPEPSSGTGTNSGETNTGSTNTEETGSGTLSNSGTLDGTGTLIDSGALVNPEPTTDTGVTDTGTTLSGSTSAIIETIHIASETITDSGATTDTGTVTDSGTTNTTETGSISDTGSLTNTGTLTDTGALADSGSLSNTGTTQTGSLTDSGSTTGTGTTTESGTTNTGSINTGTTTPTDTGSTSTGSITQPENTIAVTIPAHLVATYRYDVLGRRTDKEVSMYTTDTSTTPATLASSGTILTSFFSAGDQVIEERETANGVEKKKEYIYGNSGVDDVIAVIQDNQTYFFHKDQQGSTIALTDSTGNLVEKYRYDAYGTTYVQSGSTFIPISDTVKPFTNRLYTGREYDTETNLYYYRARTYSPSLGRFLQRDPVDTDDQVNLYAYVGNNPINRTDPSGEFGIAGAVANVAFGVGIAALESYLTGDEFNYSLKDASIDFGAGIIGAGLLAKTEKLGIIARTAFRILGQSALGTAESAFRSNCPKSQFTLASFGSNIGSNAVMGAFGKAGGKMMGFVGKKVKGKLPTHYVDSSKFPNHAQVVKIGLEKQRSNILTRVSKEKIQSNRAAAQAAMRATNGPPKAKMNYDEFPYASTTQGGKGAYVRMIDAEENQAAGRELGEFYRLSNIKPGDDFIVKIK